VLKNSNINDRDALIGGVGGGAAAYRGDDDDDNSEFRLK
jgi:hypothetical protein